MNPTDWNPLFLTLAGLGVAGVVVVAVAELRARRLEQAQAQRALWLSAATLLVGLALAEWIGARGALAPVWQRAERRVEPLAVVSPLPQQPTAPRPAPVVSSSSTVSLVAKPLIEATSPSDRVAGWMAIGWMTGAGLLLARCGLALGLLPLVRRRFQAVNDTDLLQSAREVRERLGMKRAPELRQGSVASPMTFGLLRPVVCLPADFADTFTPDHQRAVLAHEFAHIAGLDALWRCLGEVLAALLWWHPAVWIVRRRLHTACELAADEASRLAGPLNGSLAEALVALAAKPGPVAPWPVLAAAGDGYHSDLGQRVERLLESSEEPPGLPETGWRWSAGALLSAAVLMAALSACRTGGESLVKQAGNALMEDQQTLPPTANGKPQDTNLITRVFKVDPNTFVQGLESVMESRVFKRTFVDTNTFRVELENGVDMHRLVRNYFTAVGLDLTPPKAIFFKDRTGLLLVRATASDLELFHTAIEVLNVAPPQITIEARWIEVTDEGMKVLAKEWPALSPHPVEAGTLKPGSAAPDWVALQKTNENFRIDSATAQSASILTEPQTIRLLKSLEQQKDVTILASPRMTTLSGRQAQIAVQDMKTVVSGVVATNGIDSSINYQTTAVPFGPVLDLVPYVLSDGFTVQLTVMANMSEFMGYDDPGNFVPQLVKGGAEPLTGRMPLPRIRTMSLRASAVVWDGQSLLLGGLTTTTTNTVHGRVNADGTIEPDTDSGSATAGEKKLDERGGVYSVNATGYVTMKTTKHLFVLITTTIIDPAGNRVHGEEDLPFPKTSVPRQGP